MAQIIYTMKGMTKAYQSKVVLKDLYLSFFDGAKIGILGLNGSGKSTILKIMAGVDQEIQGESFVREGATVGYLEQEPQLDESKSVKENVMEGAKDVASLLKEYEEVSAKFADEMSADEMDKLINKQSALQDKIEATNAWDLERKLDIAMDALRCPPGDWAVDKLSGGEKRRVALARLLISQPDMLLLDEPTNHLDAESVAWLERHLHDYPGTVVAITHDRYFLDNVAGWILEIDRAQGIPWEGNYSSWLEQKQKRLKQEEKHESRRQKTLEKELDWIRQSPRGRQTKAKARVTAFENLSSEEFQKRNEDLQIWIPPGPRLGEKVLIAEGVSKAYGDKLLFENLEFSLPRGGIVGVIGPNGAGKTTLFKMITEQEKADKGTFTVGDTVKLAYVDQSRETLDPNKSIWEEISGGNDLMYVGNKEINTRKYCAQFNFSGDTQQKKVGVLSGGERNRVNLAKMLCQEANVILLDEPTNDLDINTLRALEEALLNYAGCAVVISHDRWFLDRIATHIMAFEGNSHVEWFEGNFAEYEKDKKRRLGADADVPTRIKYKKLVH